MKKAFLLNTIVASLCCWFASDNVVFSKSEVPEIGIEEVDVRKDVLRNLEKIVQILNLRERDGKSKIINFHQYTDILNFPYFWELNYKDKRVVRIRELVAKSACVSEEQKSIFFQKCSRHANATAKFQLSEADYPKVVLLPMSDYAEEFKRHNGDFGKILSDLKELEKCMRDFYKNAANATTPEQVLPELKILYGKTIKCLSHSAPPLLSERRKLWVIYKQISEEMEKHGTFNIFEKFPDASEIARRSLREELIQLLQSDSFLSDYEFRERIKRVKEAQ
jgi:hypothetical protein